MSIRKRGPRSYQVRVPPFPAQTAPTREAAEKLELDLRRRKSLGELYEAPAVTLGEAIDGTLARIPADDPPTTLDRIRRKRAALGFGSRKRQKPRAISVAGAAGGRGRAADHRAQL